MKESYINKRIQFILPLFSSCIIGIINFLRGDSLNQLSIKMIITIILFYIIAKVIKRILDHMTINQSQSDINQSKSKESDRANVEGHEDIE